MFRNLLLWMLARFWGALTAEELGWVLDRPTSVRWLRQNIRVAGGLRLKLLTALKHSPLPAEEHAAQLIPSAWRFEIDDDGTPLDVKRRVYPDTLPTVRPLLVGGENRRPEMESLLWFRQRARQLNGLRGLADAPALLNGLGIDCQPFYFPLFGTALLDINGFIRIPVICFRDKKWVVVFLPPHQIPTDNARLVCIDEL